MLYESLNMPPHAVFSMNMHSSALTITLLACSRATMPIANGKEELGMLLKKL